MADATVGEQLAVINVKLDTLLEQRTDHESRLRKLEERHHWSLGKNAGATALISIIASPIMYALLGHYWK